ncbi:hypothetical protein [Dactylosporangium matsuzakiense]|uniref:Uncharacterized protein n=1 Tax=Dactylosporangium matsuzakiense TaxID=53360 RepID=A0A9W6KHC5_9ACTN|nr:hypothetical protein [Dactylosporangium matsuzakiense]UWZ44083.1 hypothetical protein Dmats_42920 [Dactylosporangium matsuzakiense]GLL00780.1 hypothetical protein GCM10017581_025210 [Dactylosporangium matsuzakiense]
MTQWHEGGRPAYESYEVTPIAPDPGPAQPYSAQPYSALPYAAQPTSAQPYGYPPPSYQPLVPPPSPAPAPRRGAPVLALVGSLVVLAVVAVGIVVVIGVRRGSSPAPTAGAPSPAVSTEAAQTGPVDTCIIGNWKLTKYTSTFDLTDVVADGKPLGQVKVTGSGVKVELSAAGDSDSDYTGVSYTGNAPDGRAVTLTFSGQVHNSLKTADHQILFTFKSSTLEMTVLVNNKQVTKGNPVGKNNPQPYTCGPNTWTTTSLTDPDAAATYTRV